MKFAAIADWADSTSYPVRFMCAELGVSRAGYYAWRSAGPCARADSDATLTVILRHLHARSRGNPGVRRLRGGLAAVGHRVSHKRVWRLMRAAGLRGRHPRAWKRTTVPGHDPVTAPDLIGRDFTAAAPPSRRCHLSQRPWNAVHRRIVRPVLRRSPDPPIFGPDWDLLRQRRVRVVRDLQEGTHPHPAVAQRHRPEGGQLRLDRGLLQHHPASFHPRLLDAHRARARIQEHPPNWQPKTPVH